MYVEPSLKRKYLTVDKFDTYLTLSAHIPRRQTLPCERRPPKVKDEYTV